MKKIVSIVLIVVLCGVCFCGCGSSAKEGEAPGTAIIDDCYIKIKNLYVGSLDGTINLVLVDVLFENNSDEAHSLCGASDSGGVCDIHVYRNGAEIEMDTIGGECWTDILPGNSLNFTIRSTYSDGESGTYLVVVSSNTGKKITEKQYTIS